MIYSASLSPLSQTTPILAFSFWALYIANNYLGSLVSPSSLAMYIKLRMKVCSFSIFKALSSPKTFLSSFAFSRTCQASWSSCVMSIRSLCSYFWKASYSLIMFVTSFWLLSIKFSYLVRLESYKQKPSKDMFFCESVFFFFWKVIIKRFKKNSG